MPDITPGTDDLGVLIPLGLDYKDLDRQFRAVGGRISQYVRALVNTVKRMRSESSGAVGRDEEAQTERTTMGIHQLRAAFHMLSYASGVNTGSLALGAHAMWMFGGAVGGVVTGVILLKQAWDAVNESLAAASKTQAEFFKTFMDRQQGLHGKSIMTGVGQSTFGKRQEVADRMADLEESVKLREAYRKWTPGYEMYYQNVAKPTDVAERRQLEQLKAYYIELGRAQRETMLMAKDEVDYERQMFELRLKYSGALKGTLPDLLAQKGMLKESVTYYAAILNSLANKKLYGGELWKETEKKLKEAVNGFMAVQDQISAKSKVSFTGVGDWWKGFASEASSPVNRNTRAIEELTKWMQLWATGQIAVDATTGKLIEDAAPYFALK